MVEIDLNRTPLNDVEEAAGGHMVGFGGWRMALNFPTGGMAEHHAVRGKDERKVGIFNVSHMGRLHVRGTDALSFINSVVAYDIRKVNPNQARYTVMCNENGGVIDDLLVYKTEDPEHIPLVVNAGNREEDITWLENHKAGFDVEIEDETFDTALLAVQGPGSLELVRRLSSRLVIPEYYYFAQNANVASVDMFVSRTGYTGEDGMELWFRAQYAEDVWRDLQEVGEDLGAIPCGLAARDSLRLEAGFALHGHEITKDINPYEAGLRWVVSLEDHDFIGRDALIEADQQGIVRKLAGFRTSTKSAPRAGYQIFAEDREIGTIVSGVSSPTLEVGIGTGFLTPIELAKTGNKVLVGKEGRFQEAEVVVPPRFYKRPVAA